VAFSAYANATFSNNVHVLRLADGQIWNAAPAAGLSQFSPVWSPDGQQIAAAAGPVDGYLQQRIIVFPVDTEAGRSTGPRGVPQILPATPSDGYVTPAWTPDGNTLVFGILSLGNRFGYLYRVTIPVPELDGRGALHPTRTPAPRRAIFPTVSPDGEWMVYSGADSRDTNSTVLYISRNDGTTLRQLTFPSEGTVQDTAPAWRPARGTR
jgi:Tol biopolymer transport system component